MLSHNIDDEDEDLVIELDDCDEVVEEHDDAVLAVRDLIEKNIREYGWHGFHVFDTHPKFSYTIGLTEKEQPELIIFGLSGVPAHVIMGDLIKIMGSGLPVDTKIERVANMPLVLKRCNPKKVAEYACWIDDSYMVYDVLQIVWPDPSGYFPWDDEWDHKFDAAQPQLWDESED